MLKKLYKIMWQDTYWLIWLCFLFLASAVAELCGVLAISYLVTSHVADNQVYIFNGLYSPSQFEINVFFIAIFLIRLLVLVYSQKTTIQFCLEKAAEIKKRLLKNYFDQSYVEFVEVDLGRRIQILTEVSNSFTNTFLHTLLKLVADSILIFALLIVLAFNYPILILSIETPPDLNFASPQ